MVKQRTKARKGHVAIPFLLSFLFGIMIIGGIAMLIVNLLSGEDPILNMESNMKRPTAQNDATILFVLDEPSDPEPYTFLVARVLPSQKQIMFVSMPSNMLALLDREQDTLAGFYESGGIQRVKEALLSEAQLEIDRYMILDSAAFQKIANIFAGVYYQVPANTNGFTESADPQYLGPSQMEKLITYPMYEQGQTQRSAITADVISEMVNQTDYDRIISTMDSNFKILVNMVRTDISSIDYDSEKDALKYMFRYGESISEFRIATGIEDETDVFVLSENFSKSISEFFVPAETSSETTAQ